jgi:flagellar protein FlaG
MNSEIKNNVALSSVTPVKTDLGLQQNAQSLTVANQAVHSSQDIQKLSPSLDSIKTAAAQSNPLLQAVNLSLEYSVDGPTKEVVMKVIDNQTGKVVRQIPSSEMLDFVKRMQDWEAKQKGAVIQTSA